MIPTTIRRSCASSARLVGPADAIRHAAAVAGVDSVECADDRRRSIPADDEATLLAVAASAGLVIDEVSCALCEAHDTCPVHGVSS